VATEPVVVVPLPGGQWAAFTTAELQAGLERARALTGLPPAGLAAPGAPDAAEPWLTSAELAAKTKVGDTTWEAMAARGEVPSLRIGKALRFRLSEVTSAVRAKQSK